MTKIVEREALSKGRLKAQPKTAMAALQRRVEEAGFPRAYVLESLPSWWDDSMGETETGLSHAAMFIARRLGVDIKSLLTPDSSVTLSPMGRVCYKAGVVAEALRPATSVALSAARLVARAVTTTFNATAATTATDLRRQLFATGASAVTLNAVLAWCWGAGIPVLHLKKMPGKKPQALCLLHKGRPYIFLCDAHDLSAWQAFHLLHELGHICLGHLSEENSLCVDEKIERGDPQTEESAANAFAVEALLGEASIAFSVSSNVTAEQLAVRARSYGTLHRLDGGAIVLNAFYHDPDKKRVARNMKAVNLLEPNPSALTQIGAATERSLNWDALSDDDVEYLRCLLGLSSAPNVVEGVISEA